VDKERNMRLAVFSDVHGNLSALAAILADITAQAPDEMVFAGDLCVFGPRPADCLERVRSAACPAVYGNTDEWLVGRQQAPERAGDMADWCLTQLDAGQLAWLGALPFAQRFTPTGNPADDLLIVHANPQDVNKIIFPPEDEQMRRYGRIRQSDAELDGLFQGTEAQAVAFGHLHIPFRRTWGHLSLVNISSVSIPGDSDPRAKYGLFAWDGGRWQFELHRVAFDIAPEITAFQNSRPPGWQRAVELFSSEGFIPQNV
jgi:predicted phosphodiesterase